MLKSCITGLMLLVSLPGISQVSDTNYIHDFKNHVAIRLYSLYQSVSFDLRPVNGPSSIGYKPNVNVKFGLAGFYKWFGLGLAVENPFYARSVEKYGQTKTIDLRVNAFGRSVAGEFFYQDYLGFYISSPKTSDEKYYLLPDLRFTSYGGLGYLVFNPARFSLRASYLQIEKQRRSAGSVMLMLSFLRYNLKSDTGVVPQALVQELHVRDDENLQKGNFWTIGLSPGYTYSLVFLKDFYLNGSLFPGLYLQSYTYTTADGDFFNSKMSLLWVGRAVLGYNALRWFAGISGALGFYDPPGILGTTNYNYDYNQFRFWVGLRLGKGKRLHKNA